MAQIAALRQPDAFAGLMLTNSVAYDSWPIPSVKLMQRLAPVFMIPEGKHFTPEDHPEMVAAAINSLLSESQDR